MDDPVVVLEMDEVSRRRDVLRATPREYGHRDIPTEPFGPGVLPVTKVREYFIRNIFVHVLMVSTEKISRSPLASHQALAFSTMRSLEMFVS
jgi:hypothetical protein